MRLLFRAHAAEGLPFILEILFLSLLCVVPHFLFLVPCRKRGSIQSIPFFYSAVPADTRLHSLDDGDKKKKKKKKAKRGLELPVFIFLPSLPLFLSLSLSLPLSSSCAHTSRNWRVRWEAGRGRQSGIDVCVFFFFLLRGSSPLLFSRFNPLRLSFSLPAYAARCSARRLLSRDGRERRRYACGDICECAYVGGLK